MDPIENLKTVISNNLTLAARPPLNLTVGDMTSVLLGIVVSMVREHNKTDREEALDTTINFLLSQKKRVN